MRKITRLQYIKSDGETITAVPGEPPSVDDRGHLYEVGISDKLSHLNPNQDQELLEQLIPELVKKLTPGTVYIALLTSDRGWMNHGNFSTNQISVHAAVFSE